MIAEYHPHTVRSSRVPLYMQGFPRREMLSGLGQDGSMDPSTYDPGNVLVPPDFGPQNAPVILAPSGADLGLEPSIFDPSGTLVAPASLPQNTQDVANLYSAAVATGTITPAQAAANAAALLKAGAGVAAAATGPAYSPAPRVTVPPLPGSSVTSALTQSSLVAGVPNFAVLGIALFGLLAVSRMGKG